MVAHLDDRTKRVSYSLKGLCSTYGRTVGSRHVDVAFEVFRSYRVDHCRALAHRRGFHTESKPTSDCVRASHAYTRILKVEECFQILVQISVDAR